MRALNALHTMSFLHNDLDAANLFRFNEEAPTYMFASLRKIVKSASCGARLRNLFKLAESLNEVWQDRKRKHRKELRRSESRLRSAVLIGPVEKDQLDYIERELIPLLNTAAARKHIKGYEHISVKCIDNDFLKVDLRCEVDPEEWRAFSYAYLDCVPVHCYSLQF